MLIPFSLNKLQQPVEDFGTDAAEAGLRITDPDPYFMFDRIGA